MKKKKIDAGTCEQRKHIILVSTHLINVLTFFPGFLSEIVLRKSESVCNFSLIESNIRTSHVLMLEGELRLECEW